MNSIQLKALRSKMATDETLKSTAKERKKNFSKISVPKAKTQEFIDKGWVDLEKPTKYRDRISLAKPADEVFENRIWMLFAKMGFKSLNIDRTFAIPYTVSGDLTQQIDVLAVDDDVAIVCECKASKKPGTKRQFKKEIEAIAGAREGLIKSVRELVDNKNLKIVFAFATSGYRVNSEDNKRLEDFEIQHFDDEVISYYEDLSSNLGTASRYQLEANLFPGAKIPNLENRVPAIRGKMGGHTYYSFMIEPKKMLKLGYVLHRNKANAKLMPTYQRIIKSNRLKNIREFVENDGFFPNSLIVNIDNEKELKFELSGLQLKGTKSRIGILDLPQKFRSLFIIDGQHRLYGHTETAAEDKALLPVVAFLNLSRTDQVRLFMDINQNQKAVPRNLLHTLNADLLWDSKDLREQKQAITSRLLIELGEQKSSPLYDRIKIGENVATETRHLTLDKLTTGLNKGNFIGDFKKNSIKKVGSFYTGNIDKTYSNLYAFLEMTLNYIESVCEKEWDRELANNGILLLNDGMSGLLTLIGSIVEHLEKNKIIDPKVDQPEIILSRCKPYLDPLAHFLDDVSDEIRNDLRARSGSPAPIRYYRVFQREINKSKPAFSPEGLEKYWEDESKQFNTKSFEMIRDIESYLKKDFREKLEDFAGPDFFKTHVPKKVYDEAFKLAAEKNRKILDGEPERAPWDCLNLIHYKEIALKAPNWTQVFEEYYTQPGEKNIRGGGKAKIAWMQSISDIRNENFHTYSVKKEEYELLCKIYEWLIEGQKQSDLSD
jgi:DNA sulfur modification protein DndB